MKKQNINIDLVKSENKIVCDIDGILCENGSHLNYTTAIPKKEAIQGLNKIGETKYIILHTARLKSDKEVTEKWLKDNNVNYDKLIMGKPTASLYIDDKASRFIPNLSDSHLNRKELVICVSGGMDSAIAYEYAIKEKGYKKEDILCLNFDIGHPYLEKEKSFLEKANYEYKTIKVDLCNEELNTMPDKKNYIIPGRNMVFASIAASFGKRVWIMGMKFENHPLMFDKNASFFEMATLATTQAIGEETIIESPFINMSKTDSIIWALSNGVDKEVLENTTSCYDPIEQRCGTCSLCFKRFIAGQMAGLEENFTENPLESNEALSLMINYKRAVTSNNYSHYHKERIKETAKIVSESPKSPKFLEILADDILELIEKNDSLPS